MCQGQGRYGVTLIVLVLSCLVDHVVVFSFHFLFPSMPWFAMRGDQKFR